MKHFLLSNRHLLRLRMAVQLVVAMLWLMTGHVISANLPPEFLTAGVHMAIGNTVFQDYNRNGNQDAGEPGFANVPVRLYQSGIERGQTLTDNSGQFSFTNANVPVGIRPNTDYEIRIAAADFPAGFNLTKPGTGTPGNNAQLIGNNAVVFLTTDGSGNPPNTYGIGFAAGNPDLAITTSATNSTVVKGEAAAFTIQVNNIGSGTATSVVVSTTLDAGLVYVSSSPTATTITTEAGSTVLRWSLNTVTSGAPQSPLSVTATAQVEGVLYNTASVVTADPENNSSNNISRGCVSVPIKLCPDDEYVASLPAEYTNVQWFRNGSSTPIASGNSLTIVQSGSYSFTTTANTSCPANGCCPIIVEDGIVPNLAITPANPAICAGTTTSLTATGCTGGNLAWSTGATSVSIPVSPTATTVYSVTCNSTTYGTCTASVSTTVTVNPSVAATLAISSATVCQGTSATLTAGGGSVYLWSTGETTAFISVTVSGTYSVTVSNAQGCSDTASTTITVNPAPILTLNSPTVCAGQSTVLTVGGCSTGTLTWSTDDQTSSLTVTPLVTTVYSATCVLTTGCSSTVSATVTVNDVPTYDANVVVVPATCTGATENNDASITLTGIVNAERVDISVGSTYSGPSPGSVLIANGTVRFGGLSNPTAKQLYTVRLFAASSGCFTDVTVALDPVTCQCPAPVCVPIVIRKITR